MGWFSKLSAPLLGNKSKVVNPLGRVVDQKSGAPAPAAGAAAAPAAPVAPPPSRTPKYDARMARRGKSSSVALADGGKVNKYHKMADGGRVYTEEEMNRGLDKPDVPAFGGFFSKKSAPSSDEPGMHEKEDWNQSSNPAPAPKSDTSESDSEKTREARRSSPADAPAAPKPKARAKAKAAPAPAPKSPSREELIAQIPTGGDRVKSAVDQIPTGGDRPKSPVDQIPRDSREALAARGARTSPTHEELVAQIPRKADGGVIGGRHGGRGYGK